MKCDEKTQISVITVVYNGVKTIERTILSVLQQNYHNIEYIVVDGGSDDGTLDIIQKYSHQIKKWVSEPDQGIYDAMNKGARMAEGDVIAFLNSDDWYVEGALSYVANQFETMNIDVLFAGIVRCVGRKMMCYYPEKEGITGYYHVYHPAAFVTRKIFEQTGGFDTSYKIAADYDWVMRLMISDNRIEYVNKVTTFFSGGGVSETLLEETDEEAKSVALKYVKTSYMKEEVIRFYEKRKKERNYLEHLQNNKLQFPEVSDIKKQGEGKIFLFGAGEMGQECFQLLKQNNIKIDGFIDNDSNKWGKRSWEKKIYAPKILDIKTDIVIITTTVYEDEIKKQLQVMGIDAERVVLYSELREKIMKQLNIKC